MTDTDTSEPVPGPSQASVPEGLVAAVVNLVGTGPVLLGAYTIAELPGAVLLRRIRSNPAW